MCREPHLVTRSNPSSAQCDFACACLTRTRMCVDTSALLRDHLSHPIIGGLHSHQPLPQDGSLSAGRGGGGKPGGGSRVRISVSVAVADTPFCPELVRRFFDYQLGPVMENRGCFWYWYTEINQEKGWVSEKNLSWVLCNENAVCFNLLRTEQIHKTSLAACHTLCQPAPRWLAKLLAKIMR